MTIRRLIPFVFFCAFFSLAASAQNSPGFPDLSFNKTGRQLFNFQQNSSQDFITATLLQADGKLLVIGYDSLSYEREGFVLRLMPDGKLDQTFGTGGRVKLEELGIVKKFEPHALALQSDGGIVLAGAYWDYYNTTTYPTIVNLDAAGALKTSFNGYGAKSISYGLGSGARLNTVQVHPLTDNIIAAGRTDAIENSGAQILLVALDKTGRSLYEGNDYMTYNIGITNSALQSDATCSVRFHADSMYLGVNQCNTDLTYGMGVTSMSMRTGMLTADFGGNDALLLSRPSAYTSTYCTTIALTAAKNIIVGGYAIDPDSQFVVKKVIAKQESEDATFGTSGTALVQFSTSTNQRPYALAVDNSDRIMVGGYYSTGYNSSYWALTRLSPLGQPDTGFGKKMYTTLTSFDGVTSIVPLSTGEYLLAGSSDTLGSGISDGVIKRLDASGNPVNSFGTNSELRVWAQDYESFGSDLALRPDGKLWVCGMIGQYGSKQAAIALFNTDGTPDGTFGGKNGATPGTYIIPPSIATTTLSSLVIRSMNLLSSGKLLIAGNYTYNESDIPVVIRLSVSGDTLLPDATFGNGDGVADYIVSTQNNEIYGMTQESDGTIVLYGLLGSNYMPGVLLLNSTGTSFYGLTTSNFVSSTSSSNEYGKNMQAIVLQDNSIVLTTSVDSLGQSDFLFFRVNASGTAVIKDTTYDVEGVGNYDYAYAIAAGSNNTLYIGGQSSNKFSIIAVKLSGPYDTTFGVGGKKVFNIDYNETITGLYMDGQNIVAMGYENGESGWIQSVMRFTPNGKLDNTFSGQGFQQVGGGYSLNAVVSGNRFYTIGFDRNQNSSSDYKTHVEINKYYLGTGPVIKSTSLNLKNEVKTYGDAPFNIRLVTNSPAPITYSIDNSYSTCGTIDAKGVFTITCATAGMESSGVRVVAYQAAVPGYTEATADAYITINKGVPQIFFPAQGGVVGDTITFKYYTNSDGEMSFSQLDGYDVIGSSGGYGQAVVLKEGQSHISLTVYESSNYVSGTVQALISGYIAPVPPDAADDNAALNFGQEDSISFNILENDEAYTGTLEGSTIDLDPSTAKTDHVYTSSGLGKFVVDTNGVVTYTPFSGFIGSGSITYTVRDSKGLISNTGTIKVSVTSTTQSPALKATELITPNNDGLNEAFVIGYVDLEKSNVLRLFDRNGEEIYSVNDYKNDWNGALSNGKTAENGIYYFVFIEGSGSDQRELKGAFELRK